MQQLFTVSHHNLNLSGWLHYLLSVESLCVQSDVLPFVDGTPAVLCRRGDGFAGAAREATRGVSGC